jgi:flagellar hook-associated protein 1
MANLFASINVALSSLIAQQTATTIYEHNVANVNTEGYHRQEAQVTAGPAVTLSNSYYGTGVGQMGTGVLVTSIKRYSVDFYDTRYRLENQEAAKWSAEQEIVSGLEATLAETSTDGLLPKIDAFLTQWQSLSDNPTDISVRRELLDSGKELASAINTRYEQIVSVRAQQDLTISQNVAEINQLAERICGLNQEISRVLSTGASPNDLLDARDVALDRLAELSGATSFEQANGEVTVSINGHILVGGHESYPLHTEMDSDNENLTKIVWSDGKELWPTSGKLAGIIEARDTVFSEQRAALNELSMSLKTAINAIHSTGYGIDDSTGLDFFTGNDAGSFAVNSALEDVEKIAASSELGEEGNSDIALALSELRSAATMNSNTATFYQFYNDYVSQLGLTVKRATTNAASRSLVADALDTQRQSVSGVNLNEEAANMVKSQKAYEAAARLVSTLDEMLNTIINGMGAGR